MTRWTRSHGERTQPSRRSASPRSPNTGFFFLRQLISARLTRLVPQPCQQNQSWTANVDSAQDRVWGTRPTWTRTIACNRNIKIWSAGERISTNKGVPHGPGTERRSREPVVAEGQVGQATSTWPVRPRTRGPGYILTAAGYFQQTCSSRWRGVSQPGDGRAPRWGRI